MLNKTTGLLYLRQALDRETVTTAELLIQASHDCTSGNLENPLNTQSIVYDDANLSLLLVTVTVIDRNDNPPEFTKRWYTAGVTRDTQYGTEVINLGVSHCAVCMFRAHRFLIIILQQYLSVISW